MNPYRSHLPMDRPHGFTLIELMVTVAIAGILVAVAMPFYAAETQKSRRTDAKTALLDLAGREESYLSLNNTYTTTLNNLGYPNGAAVPYTVGSGYYNISAINITAGGVGAPPTFVIQAVPIGTQVNDQSCQLFQVDNTGRQSSTNGGGADSSAICWQ